MERIWYILLALVACVVALVLFTFGYRAIRYYNTKGSWPREFWISVAIVLAFLTSVTCDKKPPVTTCYAPIAPPQQQNTASFTELQKDWQDLTNEAQKWDKGSIPDHERISQIKSEIEPLINQIQKEKNLPHIFTLTITALITRRTNHINLLGMACYEPTPDGWERQKTLESLEKQYALLDKMHQEKKIDASILTKVRISILADYEKLIDYPTGLSTDDKNKLVDFVIGLSGIEMQGLTDKGTKEQGKLEATPEWQAMIEQWKFLTNIKDSEKTTEELDAIRKETDSRVNALLKLAEKGLISASLVELIRDAFDRAQEIRPALVSCYISVSANFDNILRWESLQTRLPLLEKAVSEGKINEWAYQKVIMRLKNDLKELDKNSEFFDSYKEAHKLTDEDIAATKKKAQELIDKIEQDGNYK